MHAQIGIGGEAGRAFGAVELLYACLVMRHHVLLQLWKGRSRYSSIYSEIKLVTHLTTACEALITERTWIWLLTRMQTHVQPEAFLECKRFGALCAGELFLVLVRRRLVIL